MKGRLKRGLGLLWSFIRSLGLESEHDALVRLKGQLLRGQVLDGLALEVVGVASRRHCHVNVRQRAAVDEVRVHFQRLCCRGLSGLGPVQHQQVDLKTSS